LTAHAQTVTTLPALPPGAKVISTRVISEGAPGAIPQGAIVMQEEKPPTDKPAEAIPAPAGAPAPAPAAEAPAEPEKCPEPSYGPTPELNVKILQDKLQDLCGGAAVDCDGKKKDPCIHIAGWADFDYTYRSIGSGENNVAPVMNRFGNEFLTRQLGLYIFKPLDPKEWSLGFNALFIAGADAAFLGPTAGGWKNTDPRFGSQFTDLNVTAHLDILTEGGVDVKAGRQTTCLGPMGAIAWQRTFDSSDYAWYNEEEGRYTGVSTVWHISKRLDWYNGVEIGGWGVFYDDPARGVDYLTQINYWLDEEAKKTKVWTTVLTGPTGFTHDGNTTVFELGIQHNYSARLWQIVDTQMVYSKAPIFFNPVGPYQERTYDVYTYIGYHLTEQLDVNGRIEWYDDVDGGGYPGGFGVPHTNYYAYTLGVNYHPKKWIEFRPEIRYDHADHPNFGANYNFKNELTIAGDVLFKF
jgi:hypothetical protein